jgi:LPS-assembly protein
MRRSLLAFFVCLLLIPGLAQAQALASLIADSVIVDPSGRITAEGNVVVFFEGNRLSAERVIYDRTTDTLSIEGAVTLTDTSGNVVTADAATLNSDLRNGVLTSARLVLDQQLQLAAARIARVDNRYTTLRRVVASSCEVCAANPTPLWEIRASRVVHDTVEQQLYFDDAQFRLAGVPILYLPRLRLPDPTLKRASGFLIPELRTSSDLGTGLQLPYFIAIGSHADTTLTPYLSASTTTLEFNYRQELRNGRLTFDGAATSDDIGGRGYFFANGTYYLPRGFVASGQLEFVSDPGYLFQYNYSSKDRLTNEFALDRVREKDLFRASVTEFRTLRDLEIPIRDALPDRFIETSYQRDLPSPRFGGLTTIRIDAAALNRPSSDDIIGRDMSRIGFGVDWSRRSVLGRGLVVDTEAALRIDAYNIGQDSTFEANSLRAAPRVATELRWPHARTTSSGASEILEPILRLDIANISGDDVPLEDSRIVEFDEANLFAPSRFPGIDGIEDGSRAAVGVNWHRSDPSGWAANFAFGRVASLDGTLEFSDTSGGADADQSEWLLAGRLSFGDRLWVSSRSLFDDNVAFTLSETRVDWQADRGMLTSSYLFAQPEPAEGRNEELSEWAFGGALDLNENWTANADWRYDFNEGRAARAGLGVDFSTDCIRIDLSVTRRYATSTSVTPTTDFGFRVSLLGVGNGQKQGTSRPVCRG